MLLYLRLLYLRLLYLRLLYLRLLYLRLLYVLELILPYSLWREGDGYYMDTCKKFSMIFLPSGVRTDSGWN